MKRNILYDLAMTAYAGGIRVAASRNRKAALMASGRRQTLTRLKEALNPDDRPVWFHASSLGEFEQARPLIEKMKSDRPDIKIAVSFFSPSGYEVRKDFPLADVVVYLPEDVPSKVKEFLDLLHPEMAIFVKYEFWRNFLAELHARKIPTYLISAMFRPDQLFFKPWGGFYRKWLGWFDRLFVQDERSRRLLASIEMTNVTVAGDTRFDRVVTIRNSRKEISEADRFRNPQNGTQPAMILAAGSSWPEDEAVYASWVIKHPEVRLILAPHEFDASRISHLKKLFGPKAVTLSEARKDASLLDKSQTLIVDCFGLLSSLYAYADVAYVGGGFGVSIHNINEAAVYGIPVVFGPNNSKFIEAQQLKTCGGGIEVSNRAETESILTTLLNDSEERRRRGKAAGNYIDSHTGATDKILSHLNH